MVDQVKPNEELEKKDAGTAETSVTGSAYGSFHEEITRDRQNLFISDLAERRTSANMQKSDDQNDHERAVTKMKGEDGTGSKPHDFDPHGPTTKMVGEDGTWPKPSDRDPHLPTTKMIGEGGSIGKPPDTSNMKEESGVGSKPPDTTNWKAEGGSDHKPHPPITTLMVGEGGSEPRPPVTDMVGEGGSFPKPEPPVTTLMVGEGGSEPRPPVTDMVGEGGSFPKPEPPITTLAVGEGGIEPRPPITEMVGEGGVGPKPFPPITELFSEGGVEIKPSFEPGKPEELPTGDVLDRQKGKQRLLTENGDVISLNQDGTFSVKGDVKSVNTTKDGVTTVTLADGEKVTFDKDGFRSIRKDDRAVFFIHGKPILNHILKGSQIPHPELINARE